MQEPYVTYNALYGQAVMTNRNTIPLANFASLSLLLAALTLAAGCSSTPHRGDSPGTRFAFYEDTFSYANELVWEYGWNEQGKWTSTQRQPRPDFSQHCFVVARSAKQFFHHAKFDPSVARADTAAYVQLIKRVISANPRTRSPEAERILIPGYANLREFSTDFEKELKSLCGGAWQSYFQRGHWRMIFPFSRNHQAKAAGQSVALIDDDQAVVLHVVRFPQLSINHAVLAYDYAFTPEGITFSIYDPNQPERPAVLNYEAETRTFSMPYNKYFYGGRVDVYPVFHRWNY